MIENASQVFVSSASIWEAAIKIKLNKLKVNIDQLIASIEEGGYTELPVTAKHAAETLKLPLHHYDPFDRILLAQARIEPLRLITADANLKKYSELVELV